MRLFQSIGFRRPYLDNFALHNSNSEQLSYQERKTLLQEGHYGASHILKPIYDNDPDAFFTVADDPLLQRAWAKEHGLKDKNLNEILLAQIEEFQPDVLYQLDPMMFPSSFVKKLPSSIKKVIAWSAAEIGTADLSAYDLIVSNFETLNEGYRKKGYHTALFHPSWDPAMAEYGKNKQRPNDIHFSGSYAGKVHQSRLTMLNQVASLSKDYAIDFRIFRKKWRRLSPEIPFRWIPFPVKFPNNLQKLSKGPIFGREMYQALSQSKVVINPATDIAGNIRGNMRCWEILGCGSCMLASEGEYPEGFEKSINFETYTSNSDLEKKLKMLLVDTDKREAIAQAGLEMISKVWSKERQWCDFQSLVET